jgi:hypothetical protein
MSVEVSFPPVKSIFIRQGRFIISCIREKTVIYREMSVRMVSIFMMM